MEKNSSGYECNLYVERSSGDNEDFRFTSMSRTGELRTKVPSTFVRPKHQTIRTEFRTRTLIRCINRRDAMSNECIHFLVDDDSTQGGF